MPSPSLSGFHHVTLPSTDLERSLAWYERAFGAVRQASLDHIGADGERIALVLDIPGIPTAVKLQLVDAEITSVRGYDPVTLAVAGNDELASWAKYFDEVGVAHAPISAARIGSVIRLDDPDGTPLRLYSLAVDTSPDSPAELLYASAQRIVNAALDFSRTHMYPPMTVAVLDLGGHLSAFGREDGATLFREKIARAKAYGALGMGVGSRTLAARAEAHPHFIDSVIALSDGQLVPVPGGVLIRANGRVIGAVGVSGHLPDNDEAAAVHGIEAAGLTPDTGA